MSGIVATFAVSVKAKREKTKESVARLEERLFEAEQALAKEERDTLKLVLKRKVNALKMTIKALKKR